MAKNQEIEFSTTAASNTDISSINIDEGMARSAVNNAMRAIMSARAAAIMRRVAKASASGPFTAVKTDHNQFWDVTGAAALTINLTAAATLSDGWGLRIRNSSTNTTTIDPNGAELIDGAATKAVPPGQIVDILCNGTAFYTTIGSASTGADVVGPASATDNALVRFDGTTGKLVQNSTTTIDDSGGMVISGALQATGGAVAFNPGNNNNFSVSTAVAGKITMNSAAVGDIDNIRIGNSTTAAGAFTTLSASGAAHLDATTRLCQNTTDTPGTGNNTVGACILNGRGFFSSSTGVSGAFNVTSDGSVVNINSGGTNQGTISVSGTTVTYGAFLGSHWSQLADGSRPDILRGTICESIDEMCEWPGEPPEERLPKFKISDTPKSRSVYGIFLGWEKLEDWSATNDAYIAAIGAGFVRVAPGITPQRGDYIESNGDGCGKIQDDDILRASTVAKITSGIAVDTYEDGSRLYPATLHCG